VLLCVKETLNRRPINCFCFLESCGGRVSVAISVWLQIFIDTLCSVSLQTVTMNKHGLSKSLAETTRCYRLTFFFLYRWTCCCKKMLSRGSLPQLLPTISLRKAKQGSACGGSWWTTRFMENRDLRCLCFHCQQVAKRSYDHFSQWRRQE